MTTNSIENQNAASHKTAIPLWTKNFLVVTTVNLFIFLSFQLFPAALPVYLKSLGASDIVVGWVGGSIIIATLLTRPFAGLALDSMGRRLLFIVGLIIISIMTIAYGLFQIVAVILIVRFMHGIGWGLASTASTTIAADTIPKVRFGEGMAYFSLSTSLAMAVAPALALYLGFYKTISIATAFNILALVLALTIKYRQIESKPKDVPKQRAALYEKGAIWPGVIMFLITCTYGAMVTFIAIYAFERGVTNIGIYFTVYAIVLLVTRPFFGKLIDRKGFGASLIPGVISAFISLVILYFANNLALFLLSGIFYGIAFGACQNALQTMAVLNSPPNRTGAANATFFTGFDGGIGFGSILAGFLTTWFTYGQMYLIISILPVASAALYVWARQKGRIPK